MISQPLQEGEVFLGERKANVELVNSVPIRLIWKRRFELLSELVRPSDMDPSGISGSKGRTLRRKEWAA